MFDLLIIQVFGVLGSLFMILSFWQKKRKNMLIFLMFDNLFYLVQYILLGAFSGAIVNVIGFFRVLLFRKKGETDIFKSNLILYGIIFLYIVSGIFTYSGINSLILIFVSIFYSFVLWQDKPSQIRIGSSIMLLIWCIYNISVMAYASAIFDGILFVLTLISFVKIDVLKK